MPTNPNSLTPASVASVPLAKVPLTPVEEKFIRTWIDCQQPELSRIFATLDAERAALLAQAEELRRSREIIARLFIASNEIRWTPGIEVVVYQGKLAAWDTAVAALARADAGGGQ